MGSANTALLIKRALCVAGQDFAFKHVIDIRCSKVHLNYLPVNLLTATFNSGIDLSNTLS